MLLTLNRSEEMTSVVSTTAETAIPTTETWTIDASHTLVEFSVKHLMIARVKGRFRDVAGSVTLDPGRPAEPQVDVSIGIASIDTGDAKRDAHLRSADFFDADTFPTMTFRARRFEGDLARRFTLTGDLTIRDVTRVMALDVTSEGRISDPWGSERMGFTATGRVNRTDYGLNWNVALEAGGVLVGEEIRIAIEAEVVRQSD